LGNDKNSVLIVYPLPEVERLIKQTGKIRMLVRMRDFRGWTAGIPSSP